MKILVGEIPRKECYLSQADIDRNDRSVLYSSTYEIIWYAQNDALRD